MLTGIAIEAVAYAAMRTTLMQESFSESVVLDDISVIKKAIETSHFDHQQKWKQMIAYEKLYTKNFWGIFYEVNPEGQIRYSRFTTFINVVQNTWPNTQTNQLETSYWKDMCWKLLQILPWLGGVPRNPEVISEWIDESYTPLEQVVETDKRGLVRIDTQDRKPFELNYKYVIHQMSQMRFPSYKKIQETFDRTLMQKKGTELVCDLVLYKKQFGQYPDTLTELGSSDKEKQAALEQYAGFVYHKTDNNFKLYHIGQNETDEGGHYKFPKFDPNEVDFRELKPKPDDILIWPEKLEDGN